jgi:hypothetical protein
MIEQGSKSQSANAINPMFRIPWRSIAVTIVVGFLFTPNCFGTDRFYRDISAASPSNSYRVDAKSPDNAPAMPGQPARRRAFQRQFTYTCTEVSTGKILWTRQQPESESSPSEIFVADDAWVAIYAGDSLICIDPHGTECGTVDILEEFNATEQARYVRWSTAGPLWKSHSLWYFLKGMESRLFVIRPWWGRRIIIDLATGRVVNGDEELELACLEQEQHDVLAELKLAVETRSDWETKEECPCVSSAYLAGVLRITDAIPYLKQLQDCPYSGSSIWSSQVPDVEGRINPFSHSTRELRQATHLSLRRLGESPGPYPATEFKVYDKDFEKQTPFEPPIRTTPRHENVSKLKWGMSPEEVITLIGEPDFVDDGWEYDLDSTPPRTLVITWGQPPVVYFGLAKEGPAQVLWIQMHRPPLRSRGLIRDQQFAN